MDLFRYSSLRKIILLVAVVDCIVVFEYYAPALMLDRFHLSIEISGVTVLSAQILASFVCYFIVPKSPRKPFAMASFFTVTVCSILLVFLWNQDQSNPSISDNIPVLILIFIF